MYRRARDSGFSLLEVLIAMTILAVGASSILALFVWAVSWQSKRHDENRLTGLYNHAVAHARAAFDAFDPASVPKGEPLVPGKIVADLTDAAGARTNDPMIEEARKQYRGCRYEITFQENDLAVPGSSVVVDIAIFGLSGQKDEGFSHKQFLTRSGASAAERLRSPSLEERDAEAPGATGGRSGG